MTALSTEELKGLLKRAGEKLVDMCACKSCEGNACELHEEIRQALNGGEHASQS